MYQNFLVSYGSSCSHLDASGVRSRAIYGPPRLQDSTGRCTKMHSSQVVDRIVVPAAESAFGRIHFKISSVHQMDVNSKYKKMKKFLPMKASA